MTLTNPLYNLIIFTVIVLLSFLLFRPNKGWFWVFKNNLKLNEKTVIEDILKQLYHYENSGKEATINNVTRSLKFNDGLIVDVLKKMSIIELIELEGDVLKLTNS